MDGLGDEGSARSRGALEEQRNIGGRHTFEEREEHAHRERLTDDHAKGRALARRNVDGEIAGEKVQGGSAELELGADGDDTRSDALGGDEGTSVATEVSHPDAPGDEGDLEVVFAHLRVAENEVVVGVGADEEGAGFEQGLATAVGAADDTHTYTTNDEPARGVGHDGAGKGGKAQGRVGPRASDPSGRLTVDGLRALLVNHLHVSHRRCWGRPRGSITQEKYKGEHVDA